jgi:hypothetical protein
MIGEQLPWLRNEALYERIRVLEELVCILFRMPGTATILMYSEKQMVEKFIEQQRAQRRGESKDIISDTLIMEGE